jgi:anti-sigma factor RsiW
MNCTDFEILLADYVDGTLHEEQRSALQSHMEGCSACAELARDVTGAIGFMERAASVEAPPELVTRILYEITSGPSHAVVKPSWARRLFGKWLEPVLQPRYAMGMAMTVLSFAMLGRLSGIEVRHLTAADLDPVKVWMSAEDRVHRTWERSVKYYESLRLVFEIQAQVKEWTDEAAAANDTTPPAGRPGTGQPGNGAASK